MIVRRVCSIVQVFASYSHTSLVVELGRLYFDGDGDGGDGVTRLVRTSNAPQTCKGGRRPPQGRYELGHAGHLL